MVQAFIGLILAATLIGGCSSSSSTNTAVNNSQGNQTANQLPTAVIDGPSQGLVNQAIEFNATGSHDPEASALSYRWQLLLQPSNSQAQISSAGDHANLLPDVVGLYRIGLIVNDGTQDSAPTMLEINASAQIAHVITEPLSLGPWQSTTGLQGFSTEGAHDSAAFAWNGFMYITGGQYGSRDRIQRAPINFNGTLGNWVDMATLSPATLMPSSNQDHLAIVIKPAAAANAVVYLVGGWNGTALNAVHSAPILPNGNLGAWTQGPSLNLARHGHAGVIAGNRLYVFGGWNNGALNSVETITLAADGSFIGSWAVNTALPQTLTFAAAVADSNSSSTVPWVLGGESPSACPTTVQSTIYRANGSNSIAWESPATLPEPLLDMGATLIHNTMIITGGAFRGYPPGTTSCSWHDATIRDSVYVAHLGSNGQLGPWMAGPTLPAPRGDHSVVTYNNVLYIIGGRSTSLHAPYPTEVWYSRLE